MNYLIYSVGSMSLLLQSVSSHQTSREPRLSLRLRCQGWQIGSVILLVCANAILLLEGKSHSSWNFKAFYACAAL